MQEKIALFSCKSKDRAQLFCGTLADMKSENTAGMAVNCAWVPRLLSPCVRPFKVNNLQNGEVVGNHGLRVPIFKTGLFRDFLSRLPLILLDRNLPRYQKVGDT